MIVKTLRFLKTNGFTTNPILTYSQSSSRRPGGKINPYPTKYGGKSIVTILPGAGIGPEIMESTLNVLEAADAPLTYEIICLSPHHDPEEFENAVKSIRRNKVTLKGNIELHHKEMNQFSRNTLLRKALDTYVYVVHCKTYPSLSNKFGNIDLTVIRQNTEGEYLMLEHEPTPQSVEFLKVITSFNTERLAEFAFNYAICHGKKQVTVGHTADVQFSTEGLFVEAVRKISQNYPQIKLNVLQAGVLVFEMVKNPRLHEVILTTNLNGSMLTNFLSGMLGGPALCSGVNLSEDGIAVFEPGVRNRGNSIEGKGVANPLAMIKAAIDLLDYLNYPNTAEIIRTAVFSTLVLDKIRTRDIGGKATTKEFTNGVIRNVEKQLVNKREKAVYTGLLKQEKKCPPPPEFSCHEDTPLVEDH